MPAIVLEHVDKIHPLRGARAHSLKHLLLALFRTGREQEVVTAARDVCLEIPKGLALGVIGANGAGKTTLLRLIAGITEPTSGRVLTEGRILSLLELGAGFHPDLSGYENIFLQGSLMGLSRERIREILPSIVAFAELENYIHMPVRHYSSGMYMRLGFAISIHVEPDILLIDEAFSVGDLFFQQKCVNQMREFHERGGTFLLVTHDIDLVEKVCDEVIWINGGRVVARGAPSEIAHQYKKSMFEISFPRPLPLLHHGELSIDRPGRFGQGAVTFDYVDFLDGEGRLRHTFENGKPMLIRLRYHVHQPVPYLDCFIAMQSERGVGAACIFTPEMGQRVTPHPDGGELTFRIDRLDLAPGLYQVTASFYSAEAARGEAVYDWHSRMYTFRVARRPDLSDIAGADPPAKWELIPATRQEKN